MKSLIKKLPFYPELRHVYRSATKYKQPFAYIYFRFFLSRKILRLSRPLDNFDHTVDYSVHLLCSHRDFLMMLWSLASWFNVVPSSGQVYIHEDGSFTEADKKVVSKIFPKVKVIDFAWASDQAKKFWLKDYPNIKEYRDKAVIDKKNIFGVKLIDPRFVGNAQKRVVIDTDLGWFKNPKWLLDRIKNYTSPITMNGREKMDFKFSDERELESPSSNVNSGVVVYHIDDMPAKLLEEFITKVGKTNPHFIEQAGYAWILSQDKKIEFLPYERYHIKGLINENTIMKHYTSPRREQFWFEGVKRIKQMLNDSL